MERKKAIVCLASILLGGIIGIAAAVFCVDNFLMVSNPTIENSQSVDRCAIDSNTTDMSAAFDDISKVYDCSDMFPDDIELSNWDINRVTDMSHMFYGCESLTTVDTSGFDIMRAKELYDLFAQDDDEFVYVQEHTSR